MTTPIDIRADHLRIVQDVLHRHLPNGVKVWVFGSRATWATKDSSDLDLALEGDGAIPARSLSALEAAFEDSDLPFAVDVVDVRRIGERFRQLVETRRLPLPVVTRESTLDPPVGHDAEGMPSDDSSGRRSGWQDTKLRDLIEIKHGFAFGGRFIHDEPDGDVLLTPGNFAIGGGFKGEKLKYYSGPVPSDFVLSKGDLIVTMTDLSKAADTLGYPAFVPAEVDGKCYLHNQRLGKIALRSQEIGARFLFYVMCSPGYRHEVLASATGTTVKHTSPDRILRFRLRLPPLAEQRAIAHILGTLDDKIELNRRMNATLESMARALFRSWFVDFDPVRAKMEGRATGLPKAIADLFPGRLVDSELGEIPEGWEVSEIGAEVDAVGGATPSTKEPAYWDGGEHHWATPKDLSKLLSPVLLETERKITDAGVQKISSGLLPPGAVLLSSRAPIGYLAITEVPTAINQGFIAMICRKRLPALYVLSWCYEKLEHIKDISGGSTFAEISKKVFRPLPVAVPPKTVLSVYDTTTTSLHERVVSNTRESALLGSLRDALLPKLVSGDIRLHRSERCRLTSAI